MSLLCNLVVALADFDLPLPAARPATVVAAVFPLEILEVSIESPDEGPICDVDIVCFSKSTLWNLHHEHIKHGNDRGLAP